MDTRYNCQQIHSSKDCSLPHPPSFRKSLWSLHLAAIVKGQCQISSQETSHSVSSHINGDLYHTKMKRSSNSGVTECVWEGSETLADTFYRPRHLLLGSLSMASSTTDRDWLVHDIINFHLDTTGEGLAAPPSWVPSASQCMLGHEAYSHCTVTLCLIGGESQWVHSSPFSPQDTLSYKTTKMDFLVNKTNHQCLVAASLTAYVISALPPLLPFPRPLIVFLELYLLISW